MSSDGECWVKALERSCVHCSREAPGEVYSGREYLRALQALRGDVAEWQAHKVEPFFWSDAEMMHVHLCDDCVNRLGIGSLETAYAPRLRAHACHQF